MVKYILYILSLCICCSSVLDHSYAIKDDLLNKAFKKSFEYEHQIDLWWARSATTVWAEVFKSSVGVTIDLQAIGNDPKVCVANGKQVMTDLGKEICNNKYDGIYTDDFVCIKNGVSIPIAATSCIQTHTNYNPIQCQTQKTSWCTSQWGIPISPPNGQCHQWKIFVWETVNWSINNKQDCLNPAWRNLIVDSTKRVQPSHCVLPDWWVKIITDSDKEASCSALWGKYAQPEVFKLQKNDPLIIRIIKFFIRMTVLLWVSIFIYIGIQYVRSSKESDSLYDSGKVRLLIQIWVGILIALGSLTILYLILSITSTGSDIVQEFSQ